MTTDSRNLATNHARGIGTQIDRTAASPIRGGDARIDGGVRHGRGTGRTVIAAVAEAGNIGRGAPVHRPCGVGSVAATGTSVGLGRADRAHLGPVLVVSYGVRRRCRRSNRQATRPGRLWPVV